MGWGWGVGGEQEWKQGDVLGSYCNIQLRGGDGWIHSEGGRGGKMRLHFGCFEIKPTVFTNGVDLECWRKGRSKSTL